MRRENGRNRNSRKSERGNAGGKKPFLLPRPLTVVLTSVVAVTLTFRTVFAVDLFGRRVKPHERTEQKAGSGASGIAPSGGDGSNGPGKIAFTPGQTGQAGAGNGGNSGIVDENGALQALAANQ